MESFHLPNHRNGANGTAAKAAPSAGVFSVDATAPRPPPPSRRGRKIMTGSEQPTSTTTPAVDKIDILLVDDMPEKLLAIEAALADLEQNVIKANGGREALRLVLQREFAVILLDINMPGMDGFETAALIRQRRSSAHTPIIFVTAFSTNDTDVYKGYALGAVDYLFTPVTPEVLRSKVSVFIELAKKNRQIQRQTEALRRAEEERLQRKLDETTQRLEWETRRNHFFRLSIELLAITNYDGIFSQVNPTWERVLNYPEDELKGQPLLSFVHPEDQAATRQIVANITSEKTPQYFENRFRTRGGAYRWLGWTIAPFAAEGLLYVFARDITERREREDEIRRLNEDLKKHALSLQTMNQELESFSYSLAHDLRTPLRSIAAYSEILLTDEAGQMQPEAVRIIRSVHRNSGRMSQLMDDFLGFFRVARQEVKRDHINMQSLAREAIAATQAAADGRLIDFQVGTLPSAKGDPAMVLQILINLVSNAVKFTAQCEKAQVEIGCHADRSPNVYYVRDNGVGFDMKYYSKLFGVFERLHSREEFDGTGIGLATVQKIVQRHGGTVWAESKVNGGATFYFTLPAP
jgi:PAS domain S-box-containing protein